MQMTEAKTTQLARPGPIGLGMACCQSGRAWM